jgi:hypothetical protein
MSFLEKATSGKIRKPKRILVYGGHGEGKSTWAAKFPNAIFLATEDGTNEIDCTRVQLTALEDFVGALKECIDSDFETVVVDSLDWLQRLIELYIEKNSIPTDYGKGALYIEEKISAILRGLDKCVESGKTVVLIAHSEIRKAEDHLGNSWDQLRPRLSKRACETVLEWCDCALLCKREDFVRTEKGDFGKEKTVASTAGRRILCTQPHPSYIAKSRIELPATIDLNDSIERFLV